MSWKNKPDTRTLLLLLILLPASHGWSSPTLTETQIHSSPVSVKHNNFAITLMGIALAYGFDHSFVSLIGGEGADKELFQREAKEQQLVEQMQPQEIPENNSSEEYEDIKIRFVSLFEKDKSGKNPFNSDSDDENERSAWQTWEAMNGYVTGIDNVLKPADCFERNNLNEVSDPDMAEITTNSRGMGKPDTSKACYGEFFDGRVIAVPGETQSHGTGGSANTEGTENPSDGDATLLGTDNFDGRIWYVKFSENSEVLVIGSYQGHKVVVRNLKQQSDQIVNFDPLELDHERPNDAVITSNSREVLISSTNTRLELENDTWVQKLIRPHHEGAVGHLSLNTDSTLMATCSTAKEWPCTKKQIYRKTGSGEWTEVSSIVGQAASVEFFPKSLRLLIDPYASESRGAYMIYFSEDGITWKKEDIQRSDDEYYQTSVAISPCEKFIAITTLNGVSIHEFANTESASTSAIGTWKQKKSDDDGVKAKSVQFSSDSSRLMTIDANDVVKIYHRDELGVWRFECRFDGENASFSNDSLRVISSSTHNDDSIVTVRKISRDGIWGVEETMNGRLAVFSPNNALIALVHKGQINIYSLSEQLHWISKTSMPLSSSTIVNPVITKLPVFSPDSTVLVTIIQDGFIDKSQGQSVSETPGEAKTWQLEFND